MTWKPVVVGVDQSAAGVHAAEAGAMLSNLMGVSCTLVHASRDVWVGPAGGVGLLDVASMTGQVADLARDAILTELRGRVPDGLLETLLVRPGPVARVLSDVVAELGAGLVVLGAKRHGTVARWLGGSTAKNAVRALHTPVLVTTGPDRPQRILVTVDLSEMAGPTLETAQAWAGLFGASLRVLHVIEPLMMGTEGMPVLDVGLYDEQAEQAFEKTIRPQVSYARADLVVRRGSALAAIDAEAAEWKADLVVLGAHGRGRMERVLMGSVSEGVVNSLPSSVLVVRT